MTFFHDVKLFFSFSFFLKNCSWKWRGAMRDGQCESSIHSSSCPPSLLTRLFFVVKLFKLWELPNERAASRTPMAGSKHGGFSTPQSILYACFNQKRTSDWLGSSTLKQVCWLTDDPASVQLQNIRSRTLSAFHRSCGFFRCWCHIFNFVFGFWEWNVDMNKLSLRMFETNWYWIGKNYKNHFQTLVMHL